MWGNTSIYVRFLFPVLGIAVSGCSALSDISEVKEGVRRSNDAMDQKMLPRMDRVDKTVHDTATAMSEKVADIGTQLEPTTAVMGEVKERLRKTDELIDKITGGAANDPKKQEQLIESGRKLMDAAPEALAKLADWAQKMPDGQTIDRWIETANSANDLSAELNKWGWIKDLASNFGADGRDPKLALFTMIGSKNVECIDNPKNSNEQRVACATMIEQFASKLIAQDPKLSPEIFTLLTSFMDGKDKLKDASGVEKVNREFALGQLPEWEQSISGVSQPNHMNAGVGFALPKPEDLKAAYHRFFSKAGDKLAERSEAYPNNAIYAYSFPPELVQSYDRAVKDGEISPERKAAEVLPLVQDTALYAIRTDAQQIHGNQKKISGLTLSLLASNLCKIRETQKVLEENSRSSYTDNTIRTSIQAIAKRVEDDDKALPEAIKPQWNTVQQICNQIVPDCQKEDVVSSSDPCFTRG